MVRQVPLVHKLTRVVVLMLPIIVLATPVPASANVPLTQISADSFTNVLDFQPGDVRAVGRSSADRRMRRR